MFIASSTAVNFGGARGTALGQYLQMNTDILETEFLVLRKTPYSDTSLIVAGIAPHEGQVHLLVRGGRRLGSRRFPIVDVFRVLNVQYRRSQSRLISLRSAELQEDFLGICQCPEHLLAAGRLARFALDNTHRELASPLFFEAFLQALRRLAGSYVGEGPDVPAEALVDATMVSVLVVFLAEHGLLPTEDDPRKAVQQKQLLDAALGRVPAPCLTPERWHALRDWCAALARYSGCAGLD